MTDWSEERPTIELVKATVTVTEVAELLGLEPNSQDKIPSPFNPDERTPSCHLYEDHWYDYSAGKGGDVIDLVQAYYPEMPFFRAIKLIWNRALRAGREPGDVERQPVRQVVDFSEQLNKIYRDPAGRAFYESQLGVPLPANVVVGWNADVDEGVYPLLMPHRDSEGCYGVKVRHPDGKKDAWPGSQFTKRLYDPHGWRHDPMTADAILTEGESDCWALMDRTGLDVLALPSGAQSWKDSWLEDLAPFDKVYLCLDNDRAGKEARDKLTRKIGYLKAEQLYVPPAFSDAREAIQHGWRPQL